MTLPQLSFALPQIGFTCRPSTLRGLNKDGHAVALGLQASMGTAATLGAEVYKDPSGLLEIVSVTEILWPGRPGLSRPPRATKVWTLKGRCL